MISVEKELTQEELCRLETEAEFSLPSDLRKFYAQHNGGIPEKKKFSKNELLYSVHKFIPILSQAGEDLKTIYSEMVLEDNVFHINCIPFAIDEGGEYFLYSMDEESFGKIFFFDSDYFDDPDESLILLSDSFTDFLTSLR